MKKEKIVKFEPESHFECGLPEVLVESIIDLLNAEIAAENGEDEGSFVGDYACCVQSNINIFEVEDIITEDQAWFLREKYLGLKKSDIFDPLK